LTEKIYALLILLSNEMNNKTRRYQEDIMMLSLQKLNFY